MGAYNHCALILLLLFHCSVFGAVFRQGKCEILVAGASNNVYGSTRLVVWTLGPTDDLWIEFIGYSGAKLAEFKISSSEDVPTVVSADAVGFRWGGWVRITSDSSFAATDNVFRSPNGYARSGHERLTICLA